MSKYSSKHNPDFTLKNKYMNQIQKIPDIWAKNKTKKILDMNKFEFNDGSTDQGYINAMLTNNELLSKFIKHYQNMKLSKTHEDFKDLQYLKENFQANGSYDGFSF